MKLFTCTRHEGGLRVTATFCGESWQRAQTYTDPEDKARLGPCLGCKVGARNARRALQPQAPLPRAKRFTITPRMRTDVPLTVERKRKSAA